MKLELKKITKYYGKFKALEDVSAELQDGVYGLLGPNGAGKTTLIGILIGILASSGGEIDIDGEHTAKMDRRYYDLVGFLPQYPRFYPNFTVSEFLSYMCEMKAVKSAEMRIREVLEFVNLSDAGAKRIGALSGGMRQRLGIAQAILNDPKLLVLDEPTAGLDPMERVRFRNLISRLAPGRIILLATHIVSDVECIAKEILLLKAGQLVMQGAPSALEDSIRGKVWEIAASQEESIHLSEMCCVTNMKQKDGAFLLRIVSDLPPLENAAPAAPNLEDVFLYTFYKSREAQA